MTVNIKTVHC